MGGEEQGQVEEQPCPAPPLVSPHLVKDGDGGRAEARLDVAQRVEVHEHLVMGGGEKE